MAVPLLTVRADWDNDGTFTGLYDALAPIDHQPLVVRRGRSADFGTEAIGALSFVLDNDDESYSPDRNWHDNPSFEAGTSGWSALAIASLTAAATSIAQVTDTAGVGNGSKAGEAVLTATVNSGVTFPIPYRFVNGFTYSISVWLKSVTGNLNVRAGMASAGTPADIASSGANITTSWAQYTFTWTPTGDRSDAVFFVRTTTAATATVRIDAINVNPGSTGYTFIEAPTKGQLVPGRPIHVYATWSAVDYPLFYGFIERLTPVPEDRVTVITCYDMLRKLSETDTVASAGTFVALTARDYRLRALSDFERGNLNLIRNPSFESNLTGWNDGFGIASRLTTDSAPGAGTCCMQLAATAGSQQVGYLIEGMRPVYFAGETYVFSIYLRTTSGTQTWNLSVTATGAIAAGKNVTVTSTWTRFYVSWTASVDIDDPDILTVALNSTASGTIRADAAAFTRGTGLLPYSDTGTGRWPNLCLNGSFEGSATGLWYDGFANLIGNPSFETDTSGWSGTADAFHGAGTITRVTTGTHKFGSAHAELAVSNGGTEGAHYAITGTFVSGVTYRFRAWITSASGGGGSGSGYKIGIGSQGTSSDKVEVTGTTTHGGGYVAVTSTWTPSANRTDAHFYFAGNAGINAGTLMFDGAFVVRRDSTHGGGATDDPEYSDTGPGTGGSFVTSNAQDSGTVKYGSVSAVTVTPATTGAGRIYDFRASNLKFRAGQTYSVSVWLRSTTAMPYRVGIGANKLDGTWDEASTTGTLTANTWTQVTTTWTPAVEYDSSANGYRVVLYVFQTNATGRTFYLDGVRVLPTSSTDDFEMTHWSVPGAAEPEVYQAGVQISGTALTILSAINASNLSRHWVEATMASPWWTYNLEDRDTYAAKASAETVASIDGWSDTDLDRSSIYNVVPISYRSGSDNVTGYWSDADSVAKYGVRPYNTIDASAFLNQSGADSIANAILQRYRLVNSRPVLLRSNVFPEMLARDLNDVLRITVARYAILNRLYAILTITLTVDQAAQLWAAQVQLEEYPY